MKSRSYTKWLLFLSIMAPRTYMSVLFSARVANSECMFQVCMWPTFHPAQHSHSGWFGLRECWQCFSACHLEVGLANNIDPQNNCRWEELLVIISVKLCHWQYFPWTIVKKQSLIRFVIAGQQSANHVLQTEYTTHYICTIFITLTLIKANTEKKYSLMSFTNWSKIPGPRVGTETETM